MTEETVVFDNGKNKKKKKKRAHPWAFPLGLLIALLSVIGLVTVIVAGVNGIQKAIVKVQNVEEYNTLLTPVVMNDPDTFDDLAKADMSELLDISIWSILKSDLSPDTYEYSDSGMVIPEEDVTAAFTKLFGTELSPVHQTVTGYGYEFTYDSAQKTYTIPLTGVEPVYTPDVADIDKTGSAVVLTVGCLSSEDWAQSSDGEMVAPEPDKYIKVTLREKDGSYYISAIQATSGPETATTSASSAETTASQTEAQSTTEAITEAATEAATEVYDANTAES